MNYSPSGRARTPPTTETEEEWNIWYGDRIEDSMVKRLSAVEDMKREINRENVGHGETMNKIWEV